MGFYKIPSSEKNNIEIIKSYIMLYPYWKDIYLKNNDLIEKIPVVIITGDDTEETIKKAFSYPILDVLNKPFKEDNIKRILVSIKSFYEKN